MRPYAVIGVLWVCLLAISPARAAPAALKDKTQLIDLLKRNQAITVIDGRGLRTRTQRPIPFSLIPGEMSVDFRGVAVVIADDDGEALALAHQLSKDGKQQIYAVAGGYPTWVQARSARQDADTTESDSVVSEDFIIPSNTCEQGDALQVYED